MDGPTKTPPPLPPLNTTGLRWRMGLIVLFGGIGGTMMLSRMAPDDTDRIITIFKSVGATLAALLVWWFWFSGVSWRTRIVGWVGFIVVAMLIAVGCIRKVTFDGDMRPRLQYRWDPPAASTLAQEWLAKNAPPAVNTANSESNIGSKDTAAVNDADADATDANSDASVDPIVITDADWPRYCGRNGDREIHEPLCSFDWKANPPKELWRHPVGDAWSSFVIVGTRLWTQEQRADKECVVCYDAEAGKELWRREDDARYETAQGAVGPRATPTVGEEAIYSLGATGILNALDPVTGRLLWQRNICVDAESQVLEWGMSGSPLIYQNTVIVDAGGNAGKAVIAYDRTTGEIVWTTGNHKAGYATPRLEEIGGSQQLLVFHGDGLDGLDPTSGKILWQYPWTNQYKINVAQPMRFGDQIFLSSGYDSGCVMVNPTQLTNSVPAEVWPKNKNLKLKFNEAVKAGNYVYGLDDGILVCIDVATGERTWKNGRYRYGQMLLWGDYLVIQSEQGYVAVVEADPQKFTEIARLEALSDRTWNVPVVNNGRLYVRNASEAACFLLPQPETTQPE